MTAQARKSLTNKYWPVLLLDTAAIAVLIILALTTSSTTNSIGAGRPHNWTCLRDEPGPE